MESKIDKAFQKYKNETGDNNYNEFLLYLAKKGLESIQITPITQDLKAFLALHPVAQIEVLTRNKPTGLDKTYWYNQAHNLYFNLLGDFDNQKDAPLLTRVFKTALDSLSTHLLPF